MVFTCVCVLKGRWLYSLLACLEKPLLPEAHSSIRQLARRCAQLRCTLVGSTPPQFLARFLTLEEMHLHSWSICMLIPHVWFHRRVKKMRNSPLSTYSSVLLPGICYSQCLVYTICVCMCLFPFVLQVLWAEWSSRPARMNTTNCCDRCFQTGSSSVKMDCFIDVKMTSIWMLLMDLLKWLYRCQNGMKDCCDLCF